jgi:hypothetical protein
VDARVSILWTAATDSDHDAIDGATRLHGVSVFRTRATEFHACIPAEVRSAAVVVITASSSDATRALALGADEVLRAGEVTPDRLHAAIEKALLRAQARAAHRRDSPSIDADAFALFAQAMTRELAQPLLAARMNLSHLSDSVPTIAEVADRLVGWASLVGGTEELRNMVALRATVPASDELQDALDDTQLCLEALDRVLKTFRAVAADATRDVTDAGVQLATVLDLVRGQLETWVDVHSDPTPAGLLVPCAPTFFSWLVGTMVDRAVLAPRATQRRGVVAARVIEREGVVVLEVEGSVSAEGEHPTASAGHSDAAASADRHLEVVRVALRKMGGDLLLDVDEGWFLARAFLPIALPTTATVEPPTSVRQRPRSRTSN